MGIKENHKMDKVTLLKKTPNHVTFPLPYGWKKFGQKRQNSDHWDFYLFSPDNKKFRSQFEVERYLKTNPNVKCDLSVTNCKWPSTLKKPNLDQKKSKSDQPKANLAITKLESNKAITLTKLESSKPKLPLSAANRKTISDSKKCKSDQPNEELQIVFSKVASLKKLENTEVKLPLSAAFRKIHPWDNCPYCGEVFQKVNRKLDLAAGYSKGPNRSLGEHQVWCLKQKRLLKAKEAKQKARKIGG